MAIQAIEAGRFLRVEEAAGLIGVSTRTVRRWIRDGRLAVAGRDGRRILIRRQAAIALRRARLPVSAPSGLVAEARAIQQEIRAWRGGRPLRESTTELIRRERDMLALERKARR